MVPFHIFMFLGSLVLSRLRNFAADVKISPTLPLWTNPAAARPLDLFGSDVMIAGALFYTIQSSTGYSGALQSDAF